MPYESLAQRHIHREKIIQFSRANVEEDVHLSVYDEKTAEAVEAARVDRLKKQFERERGFGMAPKRPPPERATAPPAKKPTVTKPKPVAPGQAQISSFFFKPKAPPAASPTAPSETPAAPRFFADSAFAAGCCEDRYRHKCRSAHPGAGWGNPLVIGIV